MPQSVAYAERTGSGFEMQMRLALVILTAFTSAADAQDSLSIADFVVPVDGIVDGQTLAAFGNAWWQWAYTEPEENGVVEDLTGERCHLNQDGAVWFLAGSFETTEVQRTCSIPAGKHLFFPLMNALHYPFAGIPRTCDEIRALAAADLANVTNLSVTLDGSDLADPQNYRISSTECFDVYARATAKYGVPGLAPSASEGYWIMLKPLPPGQHQLEFTSTVPGVEGDEGFEQHIRYDLAVE